MSWLSLNDVHLKCLADDIRVVDVRSSRYVSVGEGSRALLNLPPVPAQHLELMLTPQLRPTMDALLHLTST